MVFGSTAWHSLFLAAVAGQGGDRLTLSPGSNDVANCIIHDCNRRLSAYHPPVSILGVGNRVSHNLVYNSPQMGIYLHGNDHLIEFNDLHHCGLVCLGGSYMGQDFSERGNLIDKDPHFVDAARGNFQLQDDSPAYKLGFKRISIEKIGLYQDETRSVLPKVQSAFRR